MGQALYEYRIEDAIPKRGALSEGWDRGSGNVTWTPSKSTVSESNTKFPLDSTEPYEAGMFNQFQNIEVTTSFWFI